MSEIRFADGGDVPSMLLKATFQLRPLRTTDVELDFEAVMASRAMLRRWSDSSWPADDFTLDGNLADLAFHQREHEAGEAYTYTVMNLAGDRCLGCVYINPLAPELIRAGGCQAADREVRAASVRFWVRSDHAGSDLEQELFDALQAWFTREWPLDCVLYVTGAQEQRQQDFFAANGLQPLASYRADGHVRLPFRSPA